MPTHSAGLCLSSMHLWNRAWLILCRFFYLLFFLGIEVLHALFVA